MSEDVPSLEEIAHALSFHQLTPEQWKAWKAEMRRKPQWFVLGRPGWKGRRWRALAGPFDTPEDAQCIADTLADDGIRAGQPNLHLVYHTQIKSLPETIRIYHNNVVLLVEDLSAAEDHPGERMAPEPPEEDEPSIPVAS